MRNHEQEVTFRVKTLLPLLLIAVSITTIPQIASAKSAYVIADINGDPTPVQVYDIATNGTLTFQAEYRIPYHGSYGAVGLAIDSDSKFLFVTYELSNVIQLINAATMTDAGTTTVSGATNLAGIVYDHDKGLLYCADRYTDKLYVYGWAVSTATLTQVPGSPFTLTGATAFGIALDEINDLLYVANNTTDIRVYHTSDWSWARTISVSRKAIGIAIDNSRGLLYFGGNYPSGSSGLNYNLTQYNLATGTESAVQVEPDAGVFGIAVDSSTGFIYVSTGRNNYAGGDNLKVYNTALNQIDVIAINGNPTGIAISTKEDISYNPLNFSKKIVGSTADNVLTIPIGGTIIYNICFDNKANDYTVNNVSIIDTLPKEVSFVSADGVSGQYDAVTHTYSWFYPSLPQRATETCLQLIVQVKQDTAPGTTITNSASIVSDQTEPAIASANITTEAAHYKALSLSKSITDPLIQSSDGIARVRAGQTIVYSIYFGNTANNYPVTNVSIVDILPKEVTFESADANGLFGRYDPITHSYRWHYSSLQPASEETCLKLIVQVNEGTATGTIISNSATIESNETEPNEASVNAFVDAISYNPLNLSKQIIRDDGDIPTADGIERVYAGQRIVYGICFDNLNNNYPITNISIVDILPKEISFISADGDGDFGRYDPATHSYTWRYSSLPVMSHSVCLKLIGQVKQGTAPATTITNYVIISSNETKPAQASVNAVTSESMLQAVLTLYPNIIRRCESCNYAERILVVVELPQGIGRDDISDELLILYPGGIQAQQQFVFGTSSRSKIHAWFRTSDLLDAVLGYGEFNVEIVGKLKSGQSFHGEQIIYITKF